MAGRIEISGLTLAYQDTRGEGPAVVFVHGLGGSANCWLAQVEAGASRGWRSIAFDQRGAGRSAKPPGPYSLETWVDDLVGLLDGLGIERTALVGHSVGCMVAQRAAVELGGRVRGLALCGGALRWPAEAAPVFEERVRQARGGMMDEIAEQVATAGLSEKCRREDPRLLGLMRDLIASNDPAAYAESAAATAAAEMAGLERLRCPVLAFCGSLDPVTPPSAAAAISEIAPDGRTAEVAGAAHWPMIEDPESTSRVLLGFMDSLG